MKIYSLFLVLISLTALFSCTPDPGKATPDHTVQYDTIAGVDPNLLSLDIYNEGIGSSAPVVIWVHGGGWSIGDKANGMEFKETLMQQQNYILVSINYRLSLSGNSVQHPVHVQDVAKAIAWVYHNINDYGGDPAKIAVMGHSAGAHLAALVCTDPVYLQAEGLSLNIISGCGSFDTEAYDIPYSMANGNEDNQIYLQAFSASSSTWINASPAYHVQPGQGIPSEFLLTRRGGTVRQQICNSLRDSLVAVGTNVTVIDASSLNHEQVNDMIGAPGDQVMTTPVLQFLQAAFN